MELDETELQDFFEDTAEQLSAQNDMENLGPEAKKMGRFDSATSTKIVDASLQKLSQAVARLKDRRAHA